MAEIIISGGVYTVVDNADDPTESRPATAAEQAVVALMAGGPADLPVSPPGLEV